MSSPLPAIGGRCGQSQAPLESRDVRAHHFGAQSVVHVLAVSAHLDDADFDEHSKVVRHRRLRDGKLIAEVLTRGVAARGDPFENCQAPRVGERLRDAEKVFGREHHIDDHQSN